MPSDDWDQTTAQAMALRFADKLVDAVEEVYFSSEDETLEELAELDGDVVGRLAELLMHLSRTRYGHRDEDELLDWGGWLSVVDNGLRELILLDLTRGDRGRLSEVKALLVEDQDDRPT